MNDLNCSDIEMQITLSEKIDQFAEAFIAFQMQVIDPIKDKDGIPIKDKHGKPTNTKYVKSESIIPIRKLLNEHGLLLSQEIGSIKNNTLRIATLIMHKSGQYKLSIGMMPLPDNSQPEYDKYGNLRKPNILHQTGSAITYGRRYCFLASLGLSPCDDTDDDGAAYDYNNKPYQNYNQPPKLLSNGLVKKIDPPKEAKISQEGIDTITDKAKITKSNMAEILKHYNVSHIEDLSISQCNSAIVLLDKKIKSMEGV